MIEPSKEKQSFFVILYICFRELIMPRVFYIKKKKGRKERSK